MIREGKTCSNTTLSTVNPTWAGLGLNPGIHSERLATNHLIHGLALGFCYHGLVYISSYFVRL